MEPIDYNFYRLYKKLEDSGLDSKLALTLADLISKQNDTINSFFQSEKQRGQTHRMLAFLAVLYIPLFGIGVLLWGRLVFGWWQHFPIAVPFCHNPVLTITPNSGN